jgi:hypothetical protein
VDHAVEYSNNVLADVNNEAPAWQLIGTQVHLAAGANPHCRRPGPAKFFQIWPVDLWRNAVAWCGSTAATTSRYVLRRPVSMQNGISLKLMSQCLIDGSIGLTGGDGDGAGDTVASLSLISSTGAAAIVVSKCAIGRISHGALHGVGGDVARLERLHARRAATSNKTPMKKIVNSLQGYSHAKIKNQNRSARL